MRVDVVVGDTTLFPHEMKKSSVFTEGGVQQGDFGVEGEVDPTAVVHLYIKFSAVSTLEEIVTVLPMSAPMENEVDVLACTPSRLPFRNRCIQSMKESEGTLDHKGRKALVQ